MARSWTVTAILIVISILYYPTFVSAQQNATLSPPKLTAKVVGNSVDLSWNAVEGAIRYDLRVRRKGISGWKRLGGNSLTATFFTHKDIAAETTYRYKIRAVNAAKEFSKWSEFVNVIMDAPQKETPTATPTTAPITLATPTLTAKVEGNSVLLGWNEVEGATGYDLFVYTRASGWKWLEGKSLPGTSYMHKGLTAGVTYWYTVSAVNAAKETSGWAEYVPAIIDGPQQETPKPTFTPTATPTAAAAPMTAYVAAPLTASTTLPAPTLTAEVIGNSVVLDWNEIEGANRYYLLAHDDVSGWQLLGGTTLAGTSYTHTGLIVGGTYWYTICAATANEAGELSEFVKVIIHGPPTQTPTPTATPTSTPTSTPTATPTATARPVDPGTRTETISPIAIRVEKSIIVSWDPPASGSVSHYILTRTHVEDGVTKTKTFRLDGASTGYTDDDVGFFAYEYVVTAYLEESDPTATPTATPTTAPATLTAPTISASLTENGVSVSWSSVPGATRYDLFLHSSVSGWRRLGGTSLTGTSYTHTGVTAGVTYWYAVSAVNDHNYNTASPFSQVSVTIPAQSQ